MGSPSCFRTPSPTPLVALGEISATGEFLLASPLTLTSGQPPTVQTKGVTVPSANATLYGGVIPGGLVTTAWFEWGTGSNLAIFTSTPPQSAGSGTVAVPISAGLSALSYGTTYYY